MSAGRTVGFRMPHYDCDLHARDVNLIYSIHHLRGVVACRVRLRYGRAGFDPGSGYPFPSYRRFLTPLQQTAF